MDFISTMRMMNLFGQPQQQPQQPGLLPGMQGAMGSTQINVPPMATPPIAPQPTNPIGPTDVASIIAQIYQPQFTLQDEYNKLATSFPERTEPSNLRKVGSALYGMSQEDPLTAADKAANLPYYNKVNDWKQKAIPLQAAADNERLANVNSRIAATGAAQQIIAERKAAETERANQEKEQLAAERNEIARKRADIYAFKTYNPNWVFKAIPGGNLIAINPLTNEVHDFQISSGLLTDEDKINLQLQKSLTEIGARTQGQIQVAGVRGDEARKTKSTPSYGDVMKFDSNISGQFGGTRAESETQRIAGIERRAKEARSRNAEWARYLVFDPKTGKFQGVISPKEKSGIPLFRDAVPGGNDKTLQEINDYIYGKGSSAIAPSTSSTPVVPQAVDGWVIKKKGQ